MSFRTISAYLCNRFNTPNKANMKQKADHKTTEQQKRNMQFSEERFDLLDTIHEMIDIEFERRGKDTGENTRGNPHPKNPPPKAKGRDPAASKTEKKPCKPCHTLWQRIVRIFMHVCP